MASTIIPRAPLPERGFISAVNQSVHGARGTEHGDAYQYGYKIRDDAHGSGETVLRSLYECLIDIDLFLYAGSDETDDYCHQHDVGNGGGDAVHQVFVHL